MGDGTCPPSRDRAGPRAAPGEQWEDERTQPALPSDSSGLRLLVDGSGSCGRGRMLGRLGVAADKVVQGRRGRRGQPTILFGLLPECVRGRGRQADWNRSSLSVAQAARALHEAAQASTGTNLIWSCRCRGRRCRRVKRSASQEGEGTGIDQWQLATQA
jgi:hypothetical protein